MIAFSFITARDNSPYQAKRFLVLLIRVHINGENWAKNFLKMENKVAIVIINVLLLKYIPQTDQEQFKGRRKENLWFAIKINFNYSSTSFMILSSGFFVSMIVGSMKYPTLW